MNDYEKLKKLLQDVSKIRAEMENSVSKANEFFRLFEEMNDDCDEEIDDIDEKIEELQDNLEDEEEDTDDINKEIEENQDKRKLVVEAVEILEKLEEEFAKIAGTAEKLDIG